MLLANAVEASLKNLDSLRQATQDKAVRLTRLAEKLLYTEEGNATADPKDVHAIKFGLVNVRQFQVYVEALNQDLRNTYRRIQTVDMELGKRIEEIQTKLVEGKIL